jgi:LysM repeat protein
MSGELQKMKIESYSDERFSSLEGTFTATLNPEKYNQRFQIKYTEEQSPGTSGMALKFDKIEPRTMEFEFIVDQTGVLPGTEKTERGVEDQIDEFKGLTLGYDGNIHRTRYLKLIWGTLLFKCCMENLDVTYKMFKPDGSPVRATLKAGFKEFMEDERRVAEENAQSPDLTHVRLVKEGDTLPILSKKIYGDIKHYIDLARRNGLTNFRSLMPGNKITFPPIDKTSNS